LALNYFWEYTKAKLLAVKGEKNRKNPLKNKKIKKF
jgi:hypothetical protein